MAEEKRGDQDSSNLAKEVKARDGSTPGSAQEPTLMPAVLSNLMIAEQYIDKTKFPVEHMLICFHYGVALLATSRNIKTKRDQARRFFAAASGWESSDGKGDGRKGSATPASEGEFKGPQRPAPLSHCEDDDRKDAIDRIVSESHYNLGVIDELNGEFAKAQYHYNQAAEISTSTRFTNRFDNVSILAQLGIISSMSSSIKEDLPTKSSPAAGSRAELPLLSFTLEPQWPESPFLGISPELRNRIETTLPKIRALRTQVEKLQKKAQEHPLQMSRAVKASSSKSGGLFDFLHRSTTQSDSTSDKSRSTEETSTTVRKHEVLHEILKRLEEFESELIGLLPPPADRKTP